MQLPNNHNDEGPKAPPVSAAASITAVLCAEHHCNCHCQPRRSSPHTACVASNLHTLVTSYLRCLDPEPLMNFIHPGFWGIPANTTQAPPTKAVNHQLAPPVTMLPPRARLQLCSCDNTQRLGGKCVHAPRRHMCNFR